jgi:hypothetical protein
VRSRLFQTLAIGYALGSAAGPALGDEPGRFGRFFRFGSAPSESRRSEPQPPPVSSVESTTPYEGPAGPPPSTAGSRLIPQPRNSRAVTEADPLVTRVSLARSDDGTQFGMFLQVYADGTVIDSDGAHNLGREGVRGVVEVLSQGDVFRLRGHCGGPPTDFIEQVQMIVFERSLGRLKGSSFSFSGNISGCDPSVKALQTALDTIQTRISRPVSTPTHTPTPSVGPVASSPAMTVGPPPVTGPQPLDASPTGAPVIHLNAGNPR